MTNSIDREMERFVAAVFHHQAVTKLADVVEINIAAREMARAFHKINVLEGGSRKSFLSLLKHNDPAVRLMAAAFSINKYPNESVPVLEAIKENFPTLALEADCTLENWRRGENRLDSGEDIVSVNRLSHTNDDLDQALFRLGHAVAFTEIVEFERFDERRSSIDVLFANMIGVNEGYVELSTESSPTREQELAWLWLIRPDLAMKILASIESNGFRNVILRYMR